MCEELEERRHLAAASIALMPTTLVDQFTQEMEASTLPPHNAAYIASTEADATHRGNAAGSFGMAGDMMAFTTPNEPFDMHTTALRSASGAAIDAAIGQLMGDLKTTCDFDQLTVTQSLTSAAPATRTLDHPDQPISAEESQTLIGTESTAELRANSLDADSADKGGGTPSVMFQAEGETASRTNPVHPLDVDDDSLVTPRDALWIINVLNRSNPYHLSTPTESDALPPYPDVSGDGHVTPTDALLVINYLNASQDSPSTSAPIYIQLPRQSIAIDEGGENAPQDSPSTSEPTYIELQGNSIAIDGSGYALETNPWLSQAVWYIDPGSGDDATGDGSSLHPIKTWAALRNRLNRGTLAVATTIYIVGDLSEDLIVDWAAPGDDTTGIFTRVQGVRTTIATGTIATVTPWDAPNKVMGYFTSDVSDWSGVKDAVITITSGADAGYTSHVIGAGAAADQCRYLPFFNGATVNIDPAAGETYALQTLTKINGRVVALARGGVVLSNLEIDNTAAGTNTIDNSYVGTFQMGLCIVRGAKVNLRGNYTMLAGCHINLTNSLMVGGGGMLDHWGNWFEDTAIVISTAAMDNQGNNVHTGTTSVGLVLGGHYRFIQPYWLCVIGATQWVISAEGGSVVDASRGEIWGTGSCDSAVTVRQGSSFWYNPERPIAVAGVSHTAAIGVSTYDDGSLPKDAGPSGCVYHEVANQWYYSQNVDVLGPGNGIQKSGGGYSWNAGSCWNHPIGVGGGYIQFTSPDTPDSSAIVGLNNGFAAHDYAHIHWGWYFGPTGTIYACELGKNVAGPFAFTPGDVLRITVSASGEVEYYQNGTLRWTSIEKASFPLYPQVDIATVGVSITKVRVVT